jgi:site-specific DNA recombinase
LIFPENLTFDGFQYRTNRINEAINLISLINKKIGGKKNGTNPNISDLSQEVNPLVQNSNFLLKDLQLLVDILAA